MSSGMRPSRCWCRPSAMPWRTTDTNGPPAMYNKNLPTTNVAGRLEFRLRNGLLLLFPHPKPAALLFLFFPLLFLLGGFLFLLLGCFFLGGDFDRRFFLDADDVGRTFLLGGSI